MASPRMGVRRLAGPVALLATVLLVLLHAVAFAIPPEPLHLPGLQDGADYDSLIQPLVLALSGVLAAAGEAGTPAGGGRPLGWGQASGVTPARGPAASLGGPGPG